MAHIGVIEAIEAQGFTIRQIVGTSMGALVGGVYALGKMQAYKEWLLGLDRIKVFSLVDFTFSGMGLVKGDRVLNTMKEFTSDTRIEDLPLAYAAVAVDILNRQEVVFRTGSVYDAIRASIAIPTVFTPVKTPEGLLVDGGVLNNIPLSHVERRAGEPVIAVDVNADVPVDRPAQPPQETEAQEQGYQEKIRQFYQQLFGEKEAATATPARARQLKAEAQETEEKLGFFGLMSKTIDLMTDHITQLALEQHQPDLLIQVSRHSCGTFDFFRAEEVIELGRHATQQCLAAWQADS